MYIYVYIYLYKYIGGLMGYIYIYIYIPKVAICSLWTVLPCFSRKWANGTYMRWKIGLFESNFRFVTAVDLKNFLKRTKWPQSLHMCASISELPFSIIIIANGAPVQKKPGSDLDCLKLFT